MHRDTLGPTLERRLDGGARAMASVVDDVLASPGLEKLLVSRSPEALALLGLALNEVLYTLGELSGEKGLQQDGSLSLWTDTRLIIFCLKFKGPALPDWLLSNWDRAQEPAVLAPPNDCGWGWLLVREAIDSVSHYSERDRQILYLERRL
ncbi:MAG: hypothetical protein AAF674_10055 [Pseudomonadota bacterium]